MIESMESSNKLNSDALNVLQQTVNEVLVQASKGIKGSRNMSKFNQGHASHALRIRVKSSIVRYNNALDDLETEIVRAKEVLLRDLYELRAKRMPPPVVIPDPKPVAPPAPMAFDADSPVHTTPSTGPAAPLQGPFAGPERPMKNGSKPVAPLPDMGFDLTVSPEVRPAPSPRLSQTKAKLSKSSPKPTAAQAAAMTGRPASAPPKKEPRAPAPPPTPRTAGSTPRLPAAVPPAPVAPPAPMMTGPLILPPPTAHSTATAAQLPAQAPAPQPEMVFTDMAFSLAPAANESSQASAQMHGQTQPQPPSASDADMMDLTQFGGPSDTSSDLPNMTNFGAGADSNMMDLAGGGTSGASIPGGMTNNSHNNPGGHPANNSNSNTNMSNVDAEIENLLNSAGPNSAEKMGMEMDYELGGIGLDNNSFDEMFFDNASGGDEEFGSGSYYGI